MLAKIKGGDVDGSLQLIMENPQITLLPDDESPGYPIHVACCVGARDIVQCMVEQLPDHGRWLLIFDQRPSESQLFSTNSLH